MPHPFSSLSALVLGLVFVPSLAAQEAAQPSPAPPIGWKIRYTAMAHPSLDPASAKPVAWPIKTTAGTTIESYILSFDASGLFVPESDGKIAFSQEGAFRQQALWKAADGKAKDYLFNGRGTLSGNGELDATHLKLKLEWKSGPGRGKSLGQPITAPVADHLNLSEWELKPTKIRVRFGAAPWQEVPGYSGSRSSMMPQHLAGCAPLNLVEQIEIYQAPSADLEVTIKDDPDPSVFGGKCALTVSIKNLGPDPCPPFELNVSLPPGILVTLPKDAETVKGGFTTLLFPLDDLAKDAVATVKIEYLQVAEPQSNQKAISVAAVATLTSRAFDPNPVNNGHIELTTFRETKAGGPVATVVADVQPLETVKGWGLVVDPVGDCTFSHEEGKFTIKVPGAYHDLWPVKGQVNAPLVLQEVAGDFTVEVLIQDVTKAEPDTVLPGLTSTASFHAGSLVIWQDAKNFVRFDRTDMNKDGRATTACYLHIFQDGERTVSLAPAVPDRPTHLRLTRKGDRITAAYSQDGAKTWTRLAEQKAALPGKLKAGVSALNSTSRENVVRFADLKLSEP